MRTHERVLAQIEENLRTGAWALGERLPGERALAEQMGVSRPSVREAVRVLEAMGIVRTAVGSGPDAGATVVDRPAAGLGAAVRLHIASGTLPVHDVVATRAVLETWAVGQYVSAGVERIESWDTLSSRLCTEHKALYAAVVSRDAAEAEKIAHDHIWGFYEQTGLATESD